MQSIVNQTERRISPTRRAVATIVTLVTGSVYEFFSHQVYTPFMYLLFMIPLILGVMSNVAAKMTEKTFKESSTSTEPAPSIQPSTYQSVRCCQSQPSGQRCTTKRQLLNNKYPTSQQKCTPKVKQKNLTFGVHFSKVIGLVYLIYISLLSKQENAVE